MVLTTVRLVIVKGICDARQNTHCKGLDDMNYCVVIEDSTLYENSTCFGTAWPFLYVSQSLRALRYRTFSRSRLDEINVIKPWIAKRTTSVLGLFGETQPITLIHTRTCASKLWGKEP